MRDTVPVSPTNKAYVDPSAETILEPGITLGDLLRRNMTEPYVLQRLTQRTWWVQSFNYGTVFFVDERGVLIFDTLEGVYDNITNAVASVTDKPIRAAIYPHYHADHIGDIAKYVDAAKRSGIDLEIIASTKTRQLMDLASSAFPRPTKELKWPRDSFRFEGEIVELHGFEWAAHCDDHSAWLLKQDRIVHSPDLINPDQPPFWRFAGNERFRFHEDNLKQVYGLEWDHLSGSHGNIGAREKYSEQESYPIRCLSQCPRSLSSAVESDDHGRPVGHLFLRARRSTTPFPGGANGSPSGSSTTPGSTSGRAIMTAAK